jgi:leader peptidase (prepilin peptidase)/N-methyltransferase
MIRILGALLAGLFGLAFGSFLNTCVSRWPEDESAIKPRSHCRNCGRTLAWWENVPLASWLALRGRCRTCRAWIGWRYPLVELAVGALWAFSVWQSFAAAPELSYGVFSYPAALALSDGIARLVFLWLLVALAVLDAENFWLPDRLIWPGIGFGIVLGVTNATLQAFMVFRGGFAAWRPLAVRAAVGWFLGAVISAGVLLVVRWIYQMIRDQEGIGMGDIKLMVMLGGWFAIIQPDAPPHERVFMGLLVIGFGVVIGALVALLLLAIPSVRASGEAWGLKKLPFGTFLCLGGIVASFWGEPIFSVYRRWAGF